MIEDLYPDEKPRCCCATDCPGTEPEEPGTEEPGTEGPGQEGPESPDAPGRQATITLPEEEAADVLKRLLTEQVTRLRGRDGLLNRVETLRILERIIGAAEQYAALVTPVDPPAPPDDPEEPENPDDPEETTDPEEGDGDAPETGG